MTLFTLSSNHGNLSSQLRSYIADKHFLVAMNSHHNVGLQEFADRIKAPIILIVVLMWHGLIQYDIN
jgi:hypothetical protein